MARSESYFFVVVVDYKWVDRWRHFLFCFSGLSRGIAVSSFIFPASNRVMALDSSDFSFVFFAGLPLS